jgi:hypothetical protein
MPSSSRSRINRVPGIVTYGTNFGKDVMKKGTGVVQNVGNLIAKKLPNMPNVKK